MKDYIPEKLKDYYVPISFKCGDNVISEGRLQCSCSNDAFSVQYLGEIEYSLWKPHISLTDESIIVLIISCEKCGKSICLFDSSTDGNDAVATIVEKEETPANCSTEKLNIFVCPKCKASHFELKVKYEHPPKNEVIECGIQDYQNTFGWIWVDLMCVSCKKKFKRFLDFETG